MVWRLLILFIIRDYFLVGDAYRYDLLPIIFKFNLPSAV